MEIRRSSYGWLVFAGTIVSGFFMPPCVIARATPQKIRYVSEGGLRLVALRVVPQNPTIWGLKGSQRFLVLGKYSDGLERDLTSKSRFSVSPSAIASVETAGRVVARADGEALLKAVVEEQSAETTVRVEGSAEKLPFSFERDIGAILTKEGCNSSGCHGGVKGQGGFKLSLNAIYPREDHKWIVEGGTFQVLTTETGSKVPRVDLKEPEKSLLLLKPTMMVPHGGGQRFRADSEDYDAILNWIRAGAPYGEEGKEASGGVVRVEVFPKEVVLDAHGKHQLLVTAYLSNGRREDITDQVLYISNNPDVVKVTERGQVEAVRTGETSILVRAAGHAVSAVFGVIAAPLANYPDVPGNNFIDEHVFAKLRKFNVVPSELSGDAEFMRRACLDLTGTLPPPRRVREFLANKDPHKREKLIHVLQSSPEYVDFWSFRLSDIFRVARYANGTDGRNAQIYSEWIRQSVEQNKPYDQMARERIAAQGFDGPSRHYMGFSTREPENKVAEEVRVFMGRRLDCAQCHNHPFEAWSQDQFWGMTAFFGRINTFMGGVVYDDPAGKEVEYGLKDKSPKVVHPRTREEVQPTFLDGRVLPPERRQDLRVDLAAWMTSHPYFAEATVNRVWSYFFSRGIVEPVDDFRSTNPPTHPDLLNALAKEFRDHGYDLKQLVRTIVRSRTYQLSTQPNETNRDDRINYSHALPRPLDAEVLLDAISYITGVPEIFVPQTNQDHPGIEPPGTRAINLREPDIYPSRFCDMYARPLRVTLPERKVKPSLEQALHILAGSTYTEKISRPGGRVDELLRSGRSNSEIIEELYLTALSRFPTVQEKAALESRMSGRSSRAEVVEDLIWALISSREFSENH